MQKSIVPPNKPEYGPLHPPLVYIEQFQNREYKQMLRDLEIEKPLGETEMNALVEPFYFKYPVER